MGRRGFQSTLPREERLGLEIFNSDGSIFQSTLPREERPGSTGRQSNHHHFNPRSHERSDWYTQAGTVKATEISIHAPTRGATLGLEIFNSDGSIFQSTLPREERPIQRLPSWPERYFNPRSHERSDLNERLQRLRTANFNPRSHERSDTERVPRQRNPMISIHAPTRGATASPVSTGCQPYDFNPRSHERSDLFRLYWLWVYSISIHAPTRGATLFRLYWLWVYSISIHAPTRGATAILHKKFVYFYTIPTINI